MKRVLKRILKWMLIVLGVIVLLVLGLAVWQRETIRILVHNQSNDGPMATPPGSPMAEGLPPLTVGDADWPCWRGSKGDGKSSATGIRTDWNGGLTKAWEVDFLCQGKQAVTWSAPVIRGNRVIVCGRDDAHDLVFCLKSDDGSLIWTSSYASEAQLQYGAGSRATPWIDGERVYTYGRSGDLACWNLFDGREIWRQNVRSEGGAEPTWGLSTSPLVTDGIVIVGGGGSARTIAYSKATGDMVWKSGVGGAGYAALVAVNLSGTDAVLAFHGTGLAALALEDGRVLWDTPWVTDYDVNATTPIATMERVFITSGYRTGCRLLKVSSTAVEVLWTSDVIASHHSDPYIIDGYIYGFSGQSMQNRGVFKCVELETGREVWSTTAMGWGTVTAVEDYLLACDVKGNLFLMKPDPGGYVEVASMADALGSVRGAAWTVPVIANGRLFLRYKQRLVCYELVDR